MKNAIEDHENKLKNCEAAIYGQMKNLQDVVTGVQGALGEIKLRMDTFEADALTGRPSSAVPRKSQLDVRNMHIDKYAGEDESNPTALQKWTDSLRSYADAMFPGLGRALLKVKFELKEIDDLVVSGWGIPGINFENFSSMVYNYLKEHSKGETYAVICTQRHDENEFEALRQIYVQCEPKLNHKRSHIRQEMGMFNSRKATNHIQVRTIMREMESKAKDYLEIIGTPYDDDSLKSFAMNFLDERTLQAIGESLEEAETFTDFKNIVYKFVNRMTTAKAATTKTVRMDIGAVVAAAVAAQGKNAGEISKSTEWQSHTSLRTLSRGEVQQACEKCLDIQTLLLNCCALVQQLTQNHTLLRAPQSCGRGSSPRSSGTPPSLMRIGRALVVAAQSMLVWKPRKDAASAMGSSWALTWTKRSAIEDEGT